MKNLLFRGALIAAGLLLISIGVAIFLSEKPLITFRTRNGYAAILSVLFGERWGKYILSSLWTTAGIFLMHIGINELKTIRKKTNTESLAPRKDDDEATKMNTDDLSFTRTKLHEAAVRQRNATTIGTKSQLPAKRIKRNKHRGH
jgi:hypothetical protein